MKKFTLTLLSATCISGIADAQNPWQAVVDDMSSSMMEVPVGDFSNRKVAVVDNGFYTSHSELRGRLENGYNGRDLNTNIDASIVVCPSHHENGKTASHGTHVAGIVAQMDPHLGIVAYKRGSRGHRSVHSDVNCLKALIGRSDVQVVNLSFGINWEGIISPIKELAQEGKTIVIAAGNENTVVKDIRIHSQGKMLSEILEELKGRVVFVGATEKKLGVQRRAGFSNKPSSALSQFFIAAPGSKISSYVPLDADSSGIEAQSGTSMAAPLFVGALMRLATKFNITVDEAREVLFKTAIKADQKDARVEGTGQGIIDFKAAWAFLKNKNALSHKEDKSDNNIHEATLDFKATWELPKNALPHQKESLEENKDAHVGTDEAIANLKKNVQAFPKDMNTSSHKEDSLPDVDKPREDLTRPKIFKASTQPMITRSAAPKVKAASQEPQGIESSLPGVEKSREGLTDPRTLKASTQPTTTKSAIPQVKAAPQESQGILTYGTNLVKSSLAKGYEIVRSVVTKPLSILQRGYQYVRSWF